MLESSFRRKRLLIKSFSRLKNNLPVILIIPTVLGGILQAMQLVAISPALIRFFSVSQLISDGILIIGIIFLLMLLPYFLATLVLLFLEKLKPVYMLITSIIIFLAFIAGSYELVIKPFINKPPSSSLPGLFLCVTFYCLFYLSFKKSFFPKWSFFKYYFAILTPITGLLTLIVSVFLFHSLVVRTPINNFAKIKKKYTVLTDVKILYFNDKYIFLKVKNKNKNEEIHIEKIDSLFD